MTPPLDRFEWERLIRCLRLPAPVKLTAYAIATYANGDGTKAHPGVALLMQATGLSRRSVIDALAKLEDLGLLDAKKRGGGKGVKRGLATLYELSTPPDGSLPANVWEKPS